MVRAILEGRKTQTRRVVKGAPDAPDYRPVPIESPWWSFSPTSDYGEAHDIKCPYGAPGERLWVKEGIRLDDILVGPSGRDVAVYAADGAVTPLDTWPWKRQSLPGMFMPYGLRRITLDVVDIRVEHVKSISKDDAIAEGARRFDDIPGSKLFPDSPHQNRWSLEQPEDCGHCLGSPQMAFANLWININGQESWDANPWVWVVEFRRVEAQERAA